MHNFILANVADSLTTYVALNAGLVEASPHLNLGMELIGVVPVLVLKVVIAIVIGYIFARRGKAHMLVIPGIVIAAISILNALQAIIASV